MDEQRAARAAHRRATWTIEPLGGDDVPDNDTPEDRLARLEALRIAACVMSGRTYPKRSTREERRNWPVERIGT